MTHSPDHAERAQSEQMRQAIMAGLKAFCSETPDFDMSLGMRQCAADFIMGQSGIFAAASRGCDAVVEWEVWQDDMPVATSTSEVDAMHYLMVYGQDGPATLMRVERTEIARAALHDAAHLHQNGEP